MAAVETHCIEWEGAVQSRGYGVVRVEGKQMLAHRLAYALRNGEIPKGGQIHHACENKRCVNPDHLQLVGGNAEHRLIHRRELCKRGLHRMTGWNRMGRRCRACAYANARAYHARRKAAMA